MLDVFVMMLDVFVMLMILDVFVNGYGVMCRCYWLLNWTSSFYFEFNNISLIF